jgi:hypothetical protein
MHVRDPDVGKSAAFATANAFGYASANPITHTDPGGLFDPTGITEYIRNLGAPAVAAAAVAAPTVAAAAPVLTGTAVVLGVLAIGMGVGVLIYVAADAKAPAPSPVPQAPSVTSEHDPAPPPTPAVDTQGAGNNKNRCPPGKTGVIYERLRPGGGRYVGQSKDEQGTYPQRMKSHNRKLQRQTKNPRAQFKFNVLERCVDPKDLRKKEEDHIRDGGGPQNKGGQLENKRYEMNENDYKNAGGTVPKPTP